MADKQHYTPEQIVKAIKESQGLIYMAAERLGCSAQTVYNYGKRYASVKEALQEARGKRLDRAELALWQQINNGNVAAIIFYLKTQGKDRGYVERIENTGAGGGPVQIEQKIIEIVKDYGDATGAG